MPVPFQIIIAPITGVCSTSWITLSVSFYL
jgi:hypothetical protein